MKSILVRNLILGILEVEFSSCCLFVKEVRYWKNFVEDLVVIISFGFRKIGGMRCVFFFVWVVLSPLGSYFVCHVIGSFKSDWLKLTGKAFLGFVIYAGTVNIPYVDPMGYVKPFKSNFTVSEGNSNRRTGAGPIVLCISFLFLNHENWIEKKVVYVSQLAYHYTLDI